MKALEPHKLKLGRIVATPGALALLQKHNVVADSLLYRHARGDWGTLSIQGMASNDVALDPESPQRVLSNYPLGDGTWDSGDRIWIITEWDRSVTTLLLPEEY